jgi:hypothetical protein
MLGSIKAGRGRWGVEGAEVCIVNTGKINYFYIKEKSVFNYLDSGLAGSAGLQLIAFERLGDSGGEPPSCAPHFASG